MKVNLAEMQTGDLWADGAASSQLDTTYWLPWYNSVDLDTQLRFGVP